MIIIIIINIITGILRRMLTHASSGFAGLCLAARREAPGGKARPLIAIFGCVCIHMYNYVYIYNYIHILVVLYIYTHTYSRSQLQLWFDPAAGTLVALQ